MEMAPRSLASVNAWMVVSFTEYECWLRSVLFLFRQHEHWEFELPVRY